MIFFAIGPDLAPMPVVLFVRLVYFLLLASVCFGAELDFDPGGRPRAFFAGGGDDSEDPFNFLSAARLMDAFDDETGESSDAIGTLRPTVAWSDARRPEPVALAAAAGFL